jgi:hypothetical protein
MKQSTLLTSFQAVTGLPKILLNTLNVVTFAHLCPLVTASHPIPSGTFSEGIDTYRKLPRASDILKQIYQIVAIC